VTIETNLDNDAVPTCFRMGTRRAASRSPCDGRRCGGRGIGFEERSLLDEALGEPIEPLIFAAAGPPLCDGSRVDAFVNGDENDGALGSLNRPPTSRRRRPRSPLRCSFLQHRRLHRQERGIGWRAALYRLNDKHRTTMGGTPDCL
jgi:hypothetical protein